MVPPGIQSHLKDEETSKQTCGLVRLDARCPVKPLCHSPSSTGQGRKNTIKGSWVEITTGRDHSPVTIMGKTDST